MNKSNAAIAYDGEEIDVSDIPEITDFSKWRKNPFAGRFRNGYIIIEEHEDFNEVITVSKTRQDKNGNPLEDFSVDSEVCGGRFAGCPQPTA